MLEKIKRIALSVTLLLYASGATQAHSPAIPTAGEASGSIQSAPLSTVNQSLNGMSKPSLLRQPELKVAMSHKVIDDEVSPPTPVSKNAGHRQAGQKRKATSSASRLSNQIRPARLKPLLNTESQAAFSAGMKKRLYTFTRRYFERTGLRLRITSKYRTPHGQARAIYRNLRLYGKAYVMKVYRRSGAIREIVKVYDRNRRSSGKAIREMTKVVQAQVNRGVYISKHMRGLAYDVRSRGRNGARLSVLREVAQSMGGRVVVERNHYHVEF